LGAITDKTLIPLGLAVIAIGGGSMWLTEVYAEVKDTSRHVERLAAVQEEYNKNLIEINNRLSRIEWKLGDKK